MAKKSKTRRPVFAPISLATLADEAATKTVQKFLAKYGYLSSRVKDPGSAEAFFTNPHVRAAIQMYQRFNRLPASDGRLDVETVASMNAPRCGVPDRQVGSGGARAAVAFGRWKKSTLRYRIDAPAHLSAVASWTAQAFEIWAREINLRFEPATGSSADIHFEFKNTGVIGDVLAEATTTHSGGVITFSRIWFDLAETWVDDAHLGRNVPPVDFVTVAAHEIGHALGLDHIPGTGDQMSAKYHGAFRGLSPRDLDDILQIYEPAGA